MDGDLLFWLGIIGFWLLRRLSGKSKKPQVPAKSHPESATGSLDQLAPEHRRPIVPAYEGKQDPIARPAPRKSEFDEALKEIRKALGMSSPRPEPAAPDRYPEEHFSDVEDSFERKPAYSEGDFHNQYPDREFSARKTDFGYHSALERKGKPTAEPEKSSFGFRSALKSTTEPSSKPDKPQISAYESVTSSARHTRTSIRARLKGKKALQETALLSEILGPPLSRRTPSPRRRLS